MTTKEKVSEKEELGKLGEIPTAKNEIVEKDEIDEIQELLPQMNVSVPATQDVSNLVQDEELLGVYAEILSCIRDDRKQVSDFIDNMADMVINEGDSTTASKEALVNLVKIKTDLSDKMAKVADLMTRVKLRERDTFPKYLAAHQNNTINIGETGGSRRQLIEAINKAKKKKE